MSVWSDDEVYAKLAIAAEALAKNTAQKLPLDQTKRAGRAIQSFDGRTYRCLSSAARASTEAS